MWDSTKMRAILAELRDATGSLNKLGHRTGLSTPHLSALLDGKEPPYQSVLALAQGFPDRGLEIFSVSPYDAPAPMVAETVATLLGLPVDRVKDAIGKAGRSFCLA